MSDILNVIGRVLLISFGLVCIAAGGMCTVIGSQSGEPYAMVAVIGVVSLLVGIIVVWQTLRLWQNKSGVAPAASATDTSKTDNQ